MCNYIKKISRHRYIALAATVKIRMVVQKWLGTNTFMRTKSHAGSQFSQIYVYLGLLSTGRTDVVVHPYCSFCLRRHGVTARQSAKFRTAPVRQFSSSLRKDSVAKMDRFGGNFPKQQKSTVEVVPNTSYGYY